MDVSFYCVEDVDLVAAALVDAAKVFEPTGPYGSEQLNCRFCSGVNLDSDNFDEIEHDDDCPVLVALDLLDKDQ